ncbi:MAG: NADH-quinone oxidoreductase subunit B, partial [Candidatus Methanomethylicota archaeon]
MLTPLGVVKLLSKLATWCRKRSPWILHINTGSCNNCDIEIINALTPKFDVERFGILLEGSPRHADILVVTGPLTKQTSAEVRRIYEQTPNPKVVVAVGTCASSGGIFRNSYHVDGPVERLI